MGTGEQLQPGGVVCVASQIICDDRTRIGVQSTQMQSLNCALRRRMRGLDLCLSLGFLRCGAEPRDCIWVDCSPFRVQSSQIICDATQMRQ